MARAVKKSKPAAKKKAAKTVSSKRSSAKKLAEEAVVLAEGAESVEESRLLDEVAAVVVLTGAVFTVLSFVAYQRGSGGLNLAGRVGEVLADVLIQALGFAAYLGPIFLAVVAYLLFRQSSRSISVFRAIGAFVIVLCTAVMLGLLSAPDRPVSMSGGWVGGFVAEVLRQAFGAPGAFLMVAALMVLSFLVLTRMSLGAVIAASAAGARSGVRRIRESIPQPAVEVAMQVVPPQPKANVRREEPVRDPQTVSAPVIVRSTRDEESGTAQGAQCSGGVAVRRRRALSAAADPIVGRGGR